MADKRRILCFGDSLTWGWIPTVDGPPTERYPLAQRWPGVMQAELGDSYEIIEEALSARTTNLDDPADPRLNGASYLPSAIASHLPLDIVILMLGTNDTRAGFQRSAFDIANAIAILIAQVNGSAGGVGTRYPAPRPLLIAPPILGHPPHPWQQAKFAGAAQKTREMAELYEALADYMKIGFLNAGSIITTDGVDGVHLSAQSNADLGQAVARLVLEQF